MDSLISINPSVAKAYNIRGLAYDGSGDKVRALLDFNKAILLDPDFAEAITIEAF